MCAIDAYPGKLEWLDVNNLVYFRFILMVYDNDSFLGYWE